MINLRHQKNRASAAFTIVELLIVIVVIGILAAISIVAYNGIQSRARDAQRASDIAVIKKAILAYEVVNGGVPRVYAYRNLDEPAFGEWDISTRSKWLDFLEDEYGEMPVDPINRFVDNQYYAPGSHWYRYFCYAAGDANGLPDSPSVAITYRSERSGVVDDKFPVSRCLWSLP